MANVNINRNLSDQFYRYKMPKLLAKVEGKGNGIKTVIVNMPEIAKSLNRPPMYPTKYFGCLLGAQVNFDSKSERYIVNGAHDPDKLQDLLDGFIQKYVLCQSCQNPETILSVSKKKEVIGTNCMACGHSGIIPAAADRVAAYILKNPPPKPQAAAAPTAAAAAAAAAAAEQASTQPTSIKTGGGGGHSRGGTKNNEDDDDWGEDTNDEAVRKRMDQLSAGAKSLMLNDDLEKSANERLGIFLDFVKKQLATSDLTIGENQQAVKAEADRLDISDKAVIALCEVLFEDNLFAKVDLYHRLFLRFTHTNPKAQKYLLRGLELTIQEQKDQLLPKVREIFYKFYSLDIIDEEVFLEWFAKGQKRGNRLVETSRGIFDNARPFIEWLQQASEESGDDSDEEENVDVDFDDRLVGDAIKVTEQESNSSPKNSSANKSKTSDSKNNKNGGKPTAAAATTAAPAKVVKKEDDELDIDAI